MSNAITAKTNFTIPSMYRFGLAAIGQVAAAAFWAADRFVAYSRRQKAMDLLMEMDDRQLKDLGIIRGNIPAHVDGRFGLDRRGGS